MCNTLQHSGNGHGHGPTRRQLFASLLASGAVAPWLSGQQPNAAEMGERFRRMSAEAERKGLADPFKGITAQGEIEPGLFEIRPTGVSTAPVRNAAEKFLASLTKEQQSRTQFPVDDPEWQKWMNQHFYVRQGVSFKEMTEPQRQAAFDLMRASLSPRGFDLTRNIMRLNETLAEMTNDHEFLGEWLYNITIMGKPSASEPWGWQFDGHHAIINYFILGDQVVMTPHFFGSEPIRAASGKYRNLVILQQEQNDGLKFLHRLPETHREKAVLQFSKTGNNNLSEAFKDNIVLDYAGLRAADLPNQLRPALLDLVHLYVSNMDAGHARVKMDEVQRRLADTWFAWIGGAEPDSTFYYRIHSPVILIEFDHQTPANLRRQSPDPKKPNREHIHCVVRTPNGNDYGKDLLRQHYTKHRHASA